MTRFPFESPCWSHIIIEKDVDAGVETLSFKPVFLNRGAAVRYRALASIIPGPGINYTGPWNQLYRALAQIIPGRERFCWNLSF